MIGLPADNGSEWHTWINERQVTYFSAHITDNKIVVHFTDHSSLTLFPIDAESKESLIIRLRKQQ